MGNFITRRAAIAMLAGTAALPTAARSAVAPWTKDQPIPKIGMGTWLTFDVPPADEAARLARVSVLRAFFEAGGRFIDSSPMYGMSEDTLGFCLDRLEDAPAIAATKVWIADKDLGMDQMEASRQLWRIPRFDVMQIHNLLQYQGHIETLREMKEAEEIVALGITTSHGRRHEEFARLMETDESLDTVQFTYNIADRTAEERLLPLAAERGLKVIVNRPFQRGALIERTKGREIPEFAKEMGISTWPQFLLKWVISHPDVTVAIPATRQLDHMNENMAVLNTPQPDTATRAKMVEFFEG